MSDPAIKLFGKTIPFADTASATNDENSKKNKNQQQRLQEDEESTDVEQKEFDDNNNDNKDTSEETLKETKQEDAAILPVTSDECTNADTVSMVNEDSKTPPTDKDNAPEKNTKPEEEQSETSTSQQKTLKKPDKKLLCPRCNSMDTKFCYYNNYNVNQPRHFCKNCQRYWTDGGTMRNVPVGAGRRKNKNLASQFRHITVPEALQNAQTTHQNGMHHPSLKTNGTVLTFGSDTPLCESMASVLNLAEKSTTNYTQNGFQAPEELRISSSYGGGESSSENSNGSTVSATNTKDDKVKTGLQDPVIQNGQGFTPPIACFPGAPWPYPWNSAQWAPPLGPPAVCPPGYPMPFYPAAAYWGCSVPAAWNFSWVPQPCSPKLSTTGSAPNSPTLGKHSRDENASKASGSGGQEPTKESNTERSLWIPKTLRIDDPGDAAKSSIWTTLGIKNEQTEPISSGGLFKAFQSKNDERKPVSETSPLLQANPAALSRSVNFHESS